MKKELNQKKIKIKIEQIESRKHAFMDRYTLIMLT